MDGLVSVIIPVYNVKEYLKKAVYSVINQTHEQIEIFLIDDGSTDGSSELCDDLGEKDQRIFVIHQKNEGVVSARKRGIEKAQGEYILCVDADDWIEANMIERLLQYAYDCHADIVTSGLFKEEKKAISRMVDSLEEGLYDEARMASLYDRMMFNHSNEVVGIMAFLCSKLVRTGLLKEVFLQLSNKINYGEDAAAVYACCTLADKVVITHDVYYHYVMRQSSAVHSYSERYFGGLEELYLFLKKFFQKSKCKDSLQLQLDLYMAKGALLGINYFVGLSKKISIPYYDFDRNVIDRESKIVLYGAGQVGQSYYRNICVDHLCEITAWVDLNDGKYREMGLDVKPLAVIAEVEFDYILLAFKYEDMAEEIKKVLAKEYRIDRKKIVWLKPISILDKYCSEVW